MAQDFNGREIPNFNPDDLLGPTSSSGGGGSNVDSLKSHITAAKAENQKLNNSIKAAIHSIEGLSNKVNATQADVTKKFNQAMNMLGKMSGGGGGQSLKGFVTGSDLDRAVNKMTADAPAMRQMAHTITSPNSVVVKEKVLRNMVGDMVSILRSINDCCRQSGGMVSKKNVSDVDVYQRSIERMIGGSTTANQASQRSVEKERSTRGDKNIVGDLEFADRYAANYFRTLRKSRNYLQESLAQWIETKAATGGVTGHLHEQITALRQGISLRKHWWKLDQRIAQRLELEIQTTREVDRRNELMEKYVKHIEKANSRVQRQATLWGRVGEGAQNAIIGAGKQMLSDIESAINETTDGGLKAATDFRAALTESMRQGKALGEIAYAQGQILEDIDLTKTLMDTDAVARTGQSIQKLDRSMETMRKKGFKDQNRSQKLSIQAGKLASEIGVSVESTTDLLGDWSRHMNMSNMEATLVGRQMAEAAKNTGLVGEEMLAAAKAAEVMVKHLRNLGKFSAIGAANITELMAAGKKYGVEDQMSRLTKSLSSLDDLYADPKALTFALHAGASLSDVMSGKLLEDKGAMKEFALNQEDLLKNWIQTYDPNATGKTLEEMLANMDAGQRDFMNMVLKRTYGFTGGEISQSIKAQLEASKTFGERRQELMAKLPGATDEQRQRIMARQEQMDFTEITKHLAPLESIIEGGGGRKEILAAIRSPETRQGIETSLTAMGVKGAEQMTEEQLLRAAYAQAGIKDTGDLAADFQRALKEREKKELEDKAKTDPLWSMDYTLKQIHADLKGWSGLFQEYILNPLGDIGLGILSNMSGFMSGNILQSGMQLFQLLRHTGIPGLSAMPDIMGGVSGFFSGIMSVPGKMFGMLRNMLNPFNMFKRMVGNVKGMIMGFLDVIEGVFQRVKDTVDTIANVWDTIRTTSIKDLIANAWESIVTASKNAIVGAWNSVIGSVINAIVGLWDSIKQQFISVKDEIVGAVKDIGDKVKGIVNLPVETVKRAADFLPFDLPGFDTGTTKVARSGLAYIHAGEMIVPKEHAQSAYAPSDYSTTSAVHNIMSDVPSVGGIAVKKEQSLSVAKPKVPGQDTSPDSVATKLREERASKAGDSSSHSMARGLTNVEGNTADMLAVLQKMQDSLNKFVEVITSSQPNEQQPTIDSGDPRANRKPMGNFDYYTWNTHKYYSNATKGPVSESRPS